MKIFFLMDFGTVQKQAIFGWTKKNNQKNIKSNVLQAIRLFSVRQNSCQMPNVLLFRINQKF